MFTRQLRTVACIVALCMGAGSFAAEAAGWQKAVEDARGYGAIDAEDMRRGMRFLVRQAEGATSAPKPTSRTSTSSARWG